MTVRPFRDQDRAWALKLLGDARTIDSPGSRLVVEDAGLGVAVWEEPTAGEEAYLGAVIVPGGDRRLFHQLIDRCAQEAMSRGFERAYFEVHDRRLLRRIERDFRVEPRPVGRNVETGEPSWWEIHVDLADARRQLKRVL